MNFCYYIGSLWLQEFLWEDRRPGVFVPSFLSVRSKMSWRSQQIIVSAFFFHEHLPIFDELSKFLMSWIDFCESHFGSS